MLHHRRVASVREAHGGVDFQRDPGEALRKRIVQFDGEARALFLLQLRFHVADLFAQVFAKKLDADAEKTHVATTTFNLSKVDGEWKLDKLSEDNADCIFGGLLSAMNSINSSLNGTSNKAS